MNAIPLINNIPRPNINVGSIGSPAFNPVAAGAKLGGSIGGNVMRQNPASMPVNNETQLRQEVNTSIVALKREAFSLENLIAQAAQTLQDINKRLSELEGKQGDYVKKNDVVDSITSGNMNPVTSNAVYNASPTLIGKMEEGLSDVTDGTEFISSYASDNGFADTNDGGPNKPYKRKFIKVWNYIKAKISSWMDSTPTSGSSNPITSGGVDAALQAQETTYGFKIGNLMVERIDMNLGTLTFTNGRVSLPNAYTFRAPFTQYPTVILNSMNDQDYGYCTVIGIVRNTTKINTLGLWRDSDGTYGNIHIKGIAIGV
jgi:hypothetical protein